MPEINTRKKIIEKIDAAENILITVSNDPSVDELAAALGLTLAINKSGKRATAVASGDMPDALEFLRPEKTFENSVDSLRDFIIALSKDKADHLRYKLVGDHVKIFITPYKTTITQNDLEFEQGDFNIDLVLALGVRSKDNLDSALAAHGRILHDASTAVITVGEHSSNLAGINWHLSEVSSLSEVMLDIINGLNSKEALNKSVATALLTGIVAETDRFSNNKTSAKTMSIASKLMMSGADQQLVVSKLTEANQKDNDYSTDGEEAIQQPPKVPKQNQAPKKTKKKPADGTLIIEHSDDQDEAPLDEAEVELEKSLADLPNQTEDAFTELNNTDTQNSENFEAQPQPERIVQPEQAAPAPVQEQPEEPTVVDAPVENYAPQIPTEEVTPAIEQAFVSEAPLKTENFEPAQIQEPQISAHNEAPRFVNQNPEPNTTQPQTDSYVRSETNNEMTEEPTLGGTLNATTEEAADSSRRAFEDEKNRTILSHGTPAAEQPVPAPAPVEEPTISPEAAVMQAIESYQPQDIQFVEPEPTPADPSFSINEEAAPAPAYAPEVDLPLPPPIPDFNDMALPPLPPAMPQFGEPFAETAPSEPVPTEPAFGTNASTANIMTEAIYPQQPADPAEFRIPGM